MKSSAYLLVASLLLGIIFPFENVLPRAPQRSQFVIDPVLQNRLSNLAAQDQISVIVILSEQTNSKGIGGKTRSQRRHNLITALTSTSNRTQVNLRLILRRARNRGEVTSFTPLWVTNAIAVTANAAVIDTLAKQPEVKSIVLDQSIPGPDSVSGALSSSPVEPNIGLVNAPALWSMGYQGQGIVIANMDTGVSYTHPDLNAQWRGGTNSWYDPYGQHPTTPTDVNGHGTWTMGVMVGRDAGGTSIGMAPQASWIAVKIFNDSNSATASAIHEGFQWLLDPDGNPQTDDAPDVVNNSWTFSAPGCDLSFEPDLQALVAAGIIPVFAAGNYGPAASSSASPANNPDAFAVGATDNNNSVYSLSSRGPNSCGQQAPVIYPDVVAPGVNILSSDLFQSYFVSSGTSLAAPHVSGAVALLLNAFPGLSVADLRTAMATSAVDFGTAGPDNNYGNGRIDVLAAYNLIAGGAFATATAEPTNTADPLASETPTPTVTMTETAGPPTSTNTATLIPSATNTSTPLPSPTPTATRTATRTPTATRTATRTPSRTPTATRTCTPPPTLTSTPTAFPTSTSTASLTSSPSSTPTSFPTATPTETLTASPSPTPASLPTATPTFTSQPTATRTATPSPTATRLPTATQTFTPQPTFTATATSLSDSIFADGFESGTLSAWSLSSGGARLSITSNAAMVGLKGLQAVVSGNTPSYVQDSTSASISIRMAQPPMGMQRPS